MAIILKKILNNMEAEFISNIAIGYFMCASMHVLIKETYKLFNRSSQYSDMFVYREVHKY